MFKPMYNLPQAGNPYYNTIKYSNGYSPCIQAAASRRVKGLDTLPNCVALCVGEFNERGDYGYCKWLGNFMAYYMIEAAKKQGLKVTEKPTVGGVMCWSGGKAGEGHVAMVEKVMDNGYVVTHESEYYGKPSVVYVRRNTDGNWRTGCYWMDSSYKYQGCIMHPDYEEDEVVTDRKLKNKDTGEIVVVKGILKDGQNFIKLADLGDMDVMEVSYDAKNNLAEVGQSNPVVDRQLLNKDNGEIYTVKAVFVNGQNYVRLADLGQMDVMDVSYDAEHNLPVVGKAE